MREENEESDDSSSSSSSNNMNDEMKRLIDLWWNADTIIGKIIKYVYDSEIGVKESELIDYIKKQGSKNAKQMYHHLTTNGKEYSLVFEKNNGITKLRKEARAYIQPSN